MNEDFGDLWDYLGKVDTIFISTNLAFKNSGEAVLGRGCAFEAARRWPGILKVLGSSLIQGDYNPIPLWRIGPTNISKGLPTQLWSFPVKPLGFIPTTQEELVARTILQQQPRMSVGKFVPSWAQVADLELIEKSARYIQSLPIKSAVLPRVGCGPATGSLDWNTVSELLHGILDERFTTVTWR